MRTITKEEKDTMFVKSVWSKDQQLFTGGEKDNFFLTYKLRESNGNVISGISTCSNDYVNIPSGYSVMELEFFKII